MRSVARAFVGVFLSSFAASCSDNDTHTSSAQQSVVGPITDDARDRNQPVLPAGFDGPVSTSIPLTDEEQAAIAEVMAREAARNPPGQDPALRGFALVPEGFRPDAAPPARDAAVVAGDPGNSPQAPESADDASSSVTGGAP